MSVSVPQRPPYRSSPACFLPPCIAALLPPPLLSAPPARSPASADALHPPCRHLVSSRPLLSCHSAFPSSSSCSLPLPCLCLTTHPRGHCLFVILCYVPTPCLPLPSSSARTTTPSRLAMIRPYAPACTSIASPSRSTLSLPAHGSPCAQALSARDRRSAAESSPCCASAAPRRNGPTSTSTACASAVIASRLSSSPR